MEHLDGETRQRHTLLERKIHEARGLFTGPLAQMLGERAVVYADMIDSIFIPPMRHGQLEIPQEYIGTDNLAVVPALVGEEVRYPAELLLLAPTQRANAIEAVQAWCLPEADPAAVIGRLEQANVERARQDTSPDAAYSIEEGQDVAITCRPEWSHGDLAEFKSDAPSSVSLKGRPLILMPCDRPDALSAAILAHEFEHCKHDMDKPLMNTEQLTSEYWAAEELQAYQKGGLVVWGCQEAGLPLTKYDGLHMSVLAHSVDYKRADPELYRTRLGLVAQRIFAECGIKLQEL